VVELIVEVVQLVVVPIVEDGMTDPFPTATPVIVNPQVVEYCVVVSTWLNGL
jgi:hypothetical protein